MTAQGRRSCLYLASFLTVVLIMLSLAGQSFNALMAVCVVFALTFATFCVYQWRGTGGHHPVLSLIVFAILLYASASFLRSTSAAEHGLAIRIQEVLLQDPIWLGVPMALFAGLALLDPSQRIASIAPDIGFGLALGLAFYSSLQIGGAPFEITQSNFSPLWGNTMVHYLIVLLFFVILSYILRCAINIPYGRQGRAFAPEECSLRRFVRVLISTLPVLGFLGTVFGITQALATLPGLFANADSTDIDILPRLSSSFGGIAIAFETTMLGLVGNLAASLSLSYVEKLESDATAAQTSEERNI